MVLKMIVICGIWYFLFIFLRNLGICLFFFIVCKIWFVMVINDMLVLNGDIKVLIYSKIVS